jgi:hypothetical protein
MDIPADQYELYAEFGIAAEKAQVLEVAAGNVALSYLVLFVDTDHISADDSRSFRALAEDLDRKTLGRLLQHVKSLANFDSSMLRVINEALKQRNYLTHKFFRSHNFAIFDAVGRKAMIDELKDIQRKLDLAHAMFIGVSSILEKMAGFGALSQAIAEEFQAQGKRVNI